MLTQRYDNESNSQQKKVIIFAPTFRGNGQKSAHYNFEWFDLKKFSETFNKDYVCIFKLHPFIKNKPDYDIENDPFYIDLTSEREINDLLFVTDILITDYSSVIFEYSFFKKPVIFFTPDLEEYKNSRDFYYPLEKYTYGEVAKNFDELNFLKTKVHDWNRQGKLKDVCMVVFDATFGNKNYDDFISLIEVFT